MCLQLRQWLSAVRATLIFQTHPVFLLLSFLKSCCVSRSSSRYASAIIELSDLIIERRQRILHHWDWIYWRTQQGKRFKKALSIVHKYVFLMNIFTKLISSCRKIIAWQLQVYQGCGAEAIGSDWPKRCGRIGGTSKERFCWHHTSVKGREGEINLNKWDRRQKMIKICNMVLQDEDGKGLTDEELQAEANTFMFAGGLSHFYKQNLY